MTWEPRPLPSVTPETEPYWTAASEETLLLQWCHDCETFFHYPRDFCPSCFSEMVEWREAQGKGEVYSYSEIATVEEWPETALPLVTAYVELVEGPRMLTNLINCSGEDIEVGTSVKAAFVQTERESIAIPVFEPIES